MNKWYYKLMDQEFGPIDSEELRRKARMGHIAPDTMVRTDDSDGWRTADHIRGLFIQQTSEPLADSSPSPLTRPSSKVSASSNLTDGATPHSMSPPDIEQSQKPAGLADRCLQKAFQSAKYISVAVILCGLLTMLICAVLLVFSSPKVQPVPPISASPTVADFEEENSHQATSAETSDDDDMPTSPRNTDLDLAEAKLLNKYPSRKSQFGIIFGALRTAGQQIDIKRFTDDFLVFLAQAEKKWSVSSPQFARATMWFAQKYFRQAEEYQSRAEAIMRANDLERTFARARRVLLNSSSAAA
jgi:hypothetical protein